MTYQNDDIKNAIMQIQEFLREIQISNNESITVPIDGIYDEATAKAVREFQTKNGLNVTGTVNKETYDLLYEKALEAEFERSEPLPIYILSNGQSVAKGEISDIVAMLQIILNTLTIAYDDYAPLEINSTFDEKMENAVRLFQMRNNLAATGIVNKQTWNSMINNFNKHIGENQ